MRICIIGYDFIFIFYFIYSILLYGKCVETNKWVEHGIRVCFPYILQHSDTILCRHTTHIITFVWPIRWYNTHQLIHWSTNMHTYISYDIRYRIHFLKYYVQNSMSPTDVHGVFLQICNKSHISKEWFAGEQTAISDIKQGPNYSSIPWFQQCIS